MNEQTINNLYGIEPEQRLKDGFFTNGGYSFYIYTIDYVDEEEMEERYQMANYLHSKGEKGVLIPIRNRQRAFISTEDNNKFVLLGLGSTLPSNELLGRKLAAFHYRGRSIGQQVQKLNRIGQWKELWEKRIDQLESLWQEKMFATPQNEFEKIFIENFPYFSGLTENAIQYLVDTELDEQPGTMDIGTICHERFGSQSWYGQLPGKNPFNWVFDHASRDLAEWVRECYFQNQNTYHYKIDNFMKEYIQAIQLSPFSIRLLYARLLLPVHFFETVEQYFISGSEGERQTLEDRLVSDVKNTQYYEQFLKYFFSLELIPQIKTIIKIPEWLA